MKKIVKIDLKSKQVIYTEGLKGVTYKDGKVSMCVHSDLDYYFEILDGGIWQTFTGASDKAISYTVDYIYTNVDGIATITLMEDDK